MHFIVMAFESIFWIAYLGFSGFIGLILGLMSSLLLLYDDIAVISSVLIFYLIMVAVNIFCNKNKDYDFVDIIFCSKKYSDRDSSYRFWKCFWLTSILVSIVSISLLIKDFLIL